MNRFDVMRLIQANDQLEASQVAGLRSGELKGCLDYAIEKGKLQIAKLLDSIEHFPISERNYAMCTASKRGDLDSLVYLLESGGDPNSACGITRIPALLLGCAAGSSAVVQALLEKGANPNSHDLPLGGAEKETGRTALMVAAEKGNGEIVKLLLNYNADPYIVGEKKRTALELAGRKHVKGPIVALLKAHKDVSISRGSRSKNVAKGRAKLDFRNVETLEASLTNLTGSSGKYLEDPKSVLTYPLSINVARAISNAAPANGPGHLIIDLLKAVETIKADCKKAGAYCFLRIPALTDIQLCLIKGADMWGVLRSFRTACANYGIEHTELVRFLKKVYMKQPFDLTECNFDVVGGTFRNLPFEPLRLAKTLVEFCPFAASDYGNSAAKYAKALVKHRRFRFYWD